LAAIRSDLSNAFSTEGDSDDEIFDLERFRAKRQAELEASRVQSQPEEDHTEGARGGGYSPQFAVHRSADVVILGTGVTSQPRSPFVAVHLGTNVETPSTSSSSTALTKESYRNDRNEEPESPYPDTQTIDEQDEGGELDMPTQAFEDISLEEDDDGAVTPTSARSPQSGTMDSHSPQVSDVYSSQRGDVNSRGLNGPQLSSSNATGPPLGTAIASAPAFAAQFKKTRKTGRSALQKVISKTRPTHLPPKPKEEDVRHLKVWEDMMKKSKHAGKSVPIYKKFSEANPPSGRGETEARAFATPRGTRERGRRLYPSMATRSSS